jgi:gliotoxin/aspirochlorine biosynthesis glutathione S-transferase
MIPALEDFADESKDEPRRRVAVWESTSCLTFLADKYDSEGLFSGRNLYERTQVGNWMALHTASLG